jgi:NADH-quinone oxidoreductase subunit J
MNTMITSTVLLLLMLLFSLWAVMTKTLLKSAIGLALASAVLTVLMFTLGAPMAAVFELSVCAGLITVVFVSTISLTKPLPHEVEMERDREVHRWAWILPVLLLASGLALKFVPFTFDFNLPLPTDDNDFRSVLWNTRLLDILGQISVILAGVFGIVILFKEKNEHER